MQLFINYAHADKAEVGELLDILKSGQHEAWLDKPLPAVADWKPAMLSLLQQADVFVHVISNQSMKNEWCQWLLSQAIKLGKPIVAAQILPVAEFPALFVGKPYADLVDGAKPEVVAQLVSSLYAPLTIPAEEAPAAPENPQGKPAHAMRDSMIFISYSRKNQDYAYRLEKHLEERGFSVWIDKESISYGDQWVRKIKRAIETCAAYMVIMTPDAENSEWVQRELHYAQELKKPIFPLLLADKIWFQLSTTHVLDVTNGTLPPEEFLNRLAEVAPRENIPVVATAAAVTRQLYLSAFEQDPLVQPYQQALHHLITTECPTQWQIKVATPTSLAEVQAAISAADLTVILLGAFYGQVWPDQESSLPELTLKTATEQQKNHLAVVLDSELPAGIPLEFLALHGAGVARQLALRNNAAGAVHVNSVEGFTMLLRDKLTQMAAVEAAPPVAAMPAPAKPFFSPDDQSHLSYDRHTLEAYDRDDLDQDLLKRFLDRPLARDAALRAKLPPHDIAAHLQILGLTVDHKITLASFLAFAPMTLIVSQFSACALQMVVYDQVKRAEASADINVVTDNLLNLWDAGLEFLRRKSGLKRNGKVGSDQRDELEIPEIALREALANALVHRDYEDPMLREQPTLIEVYPDRVEITSFGKLPEGITAERLNTEPENIHSVRRNPLIASIFQYMAYMELNGSGISRMCAAAEKASLPRPVITENEERATVKVTFQRKKKRQGSKSKAAT